MRLPILQRLTGASLQGDAVARDDGVAWFAVPVTRKISAAQLAFNAGAERKRVNATQRPPVAPAEVIRLGHYVLEVADFQATCAWYTEHLGLCGPVVVTDDNLHEFVAGAVIVNDYSARDVQIPEMQFYKGKSFRTFGPVGPHPTLLDQNDIGAVKRLRLTLTVNGQVRQDDTTANLVYGPAETLPASTSASSATVSSRRCDMESIATRGMTVRVNCGNFGSFVDLRASPHASVGSPGQPDRSRRLLPFAISRMGCVPAY